MNLHSLPCTPPLSTSTSKTAITSMMLTIMGTLMGNTACRRLIKKALIAGAKTKHEWNTLHLLESNKIVPYRNTASL